MRAEPRKKKWDSEKIFQHRREVKEIPQNDNKETCTGSEFYIKRSNHSGWEQETEMPEKDVSIQSRSNVEEFFKKFKCSHSALHS